MIDLELKKSETSLEYINKLRQIYSDKLDLSLIKFCNLRDNVTVRCIKHDYTFSRRASRLLKYGCSKCKNENVPNHNAMSQKEFINKITKIHLTLDFTATKYINTDTEVQVTCSNNHIFYKKPKLLIQGNGCNLCRPRSLSETEVQNYISSLIDNEVLFGYRPKWLNRKELDIYIPDLNLAIEYNGTVYHHSSNSAETKSFYLKTYKAPDYHFQKWKLCFDNNVSLLSIYDFYWTDPFKQSILKSKIRQHLNLDTKICAKECSIKQVDNKTAYLFYKLNHLENININHKNHISYGLYLNDKLIMCATIAQPDWQASKKVFKNKLHSICTLLDFTVIGGSNKLLEHLYNKYGKFTYQVPLYSVEPDLKYNKEFKILPLRYFWVNIKTLQYFDEKYCQKHLLKKHFKSPLLSEDTESTYMERLGYLKVFDNGLAEINWNGTHK